MNKSVRTAASVLSFLGPLLLYVWTTGAQSYFLDSIEFVGVSARLGVAHPPGTPLYVLLGHLAVSLFPFGAAAFRVHLLNALLAGLLGRLLLALGRRLAGGATSAWGEGFLLILVLAFATSPALWFQSVRAEVYTLNALLCLGFLALLVAWNDRPADWGLGVVAAFVAGLGMTNHHYLMVLTLLSGVVLPVMNPQIRRVLLSWKILVFVIAGLLGLMPYLYLPIRAHQGWLMWGDPATLSGFFSILSAQAYQSSMSTGEKAPLLVAMADIFGGWFDLLGVVLALVGMLGLLVLVWKDRTVGLLLMSALLAGLVAKAVMYLDLKNPDDHGYFLIGLQVLVLGGAGWLRVSGAVAGRAAWVFLLLGVPVAVQAGVEWKPRLEQCRLDGFSGPDLINRHFFEGLPPDAVFLPSYYPLTFTYRTFSEAEGRRPDVALLHQSLYSNYWRGKGFALQARQRHPDLSGIVEEYQASGRFPTEALRAAASLRPVVLEADVWQVFRPLEVVQRFGLGQGGLELETWGNPPPADQVGKRLHAMELEFESGGVRLLTMQTWGVDEPRRMVDFWRSFYTALEGSQVHPELKKILLWIHYRDALYFINRGRASLALKEVQLALRAVPAGGPDAQHLADLAAILSDASQSVEIVPPPRQECQSPFTVQ